MESIVLPNMDDIAFFDSSKYKHRGGIFPDAARNERKEDADEDVEEQEENSPLLETTPEDEGAPIKRSHSAGEVTDTKDASADLSSRAKDRSTTIAAPAPSHDNLSSSPSNNDTWLSPSNSAGDTTLVTDDPEPLPGTEEELHRHEIPRVKTPDPSGTTDSSGKKVKKKGSKFLSTARKLSRSPAPSIRSRASSRTPSPSPSFERLQSEPALVAPSSSSMKSDKSSDHSMKISDHGGSKSPNGNTFLSTLKSRAADRQALGQSAKDAMRKWGVNWTGSKKENGQPHDIPDGGSAHQRMSSDSSNSSNIHKTSYAEVRAHVAQRKAGAGSRATEPGMPSRVPSAPIVIPGSDAVKDRTVSMSSEGGSSIISVDDASSSPVSSFRGRPFSRTEEEMNPTPRAGTSPSSSTALDVPNRRRDGSSDSRSKTVDASPVRQPEDLSESESPSMPIHTQPPQAKMMTIPGIHASHRGEVMSMGYVPPAPPPPPTEHKTKTTAGIQSLSRLFNRNPNSAALAESAAPSQSAPADLDTLVEDKQLQTSTPAATPNKPRPAPPPLPPRTASSLSASSSRSSPIQPTVSTLGSASDTLRSIATKDDERKRASMEMTKSPLSIHIDEGEVDQTESSPSDPEPGLTPSSPASSSSGPPNSATPNITFTAPTPVYPTAQKPPLPPRRPTVTAST